MLLNLIEIKNQLHRLLNEQMPPLRIREDNEFKFEVCGSKEAKQGKKKVDGFYFASVIEKPKDIRFYFFPIYTHADQFTNLPPELKKKLKGKSCFHLKNLTKKEMAGIAEMIQKGVKLYLQDDLI